MPEVRFPDERTTALLKRLDARIQSRAATPAKQVSAERWAYREAAAVLVAFDLATLRPASDSLAAPGNPAVLLPDIMRTSSGQSRSRYALTADVRRQALQRGRSRDRIRAALDANPDRPRDPFQLLFEQWLTGAPPPLESQRYDELARSAQIASWLEGVLSGVPSPADVQPLLDRQSVYALFDHLATDDFTGRARELRALREHVGVLEPGTLADAVRRQLRSWVGARRRAPLVILGAGGVGKSALLGRFLIEHASVPPEARFPFAYLAFDSLALRIEEPFTLIAEMVRQLELLNRDRAAVFDRFRKHDASYRSQRRSLDEKTQASPSRRERAGSLHDVEGKFYQAFADVVMALCAREESSALAPFLLVFDTFEEAQYRGAERLIGFMRMLEALHAQCPSLRLVFCTRPPFMARLPKLLGTPSTLELDDLPQPDAEALLRRLGVTDEDLARTVAKQIGGNPLNLRFAARLAEREAIDGRGIPGISTTSWLLFSVSAETVRGQLYARILDHIHDEDVRRLAHPGMVVRRVNPDVIQEVLAGPCGVSVPTRQRAEALFQGLEREHTLLERAEGGALQYRADVRASMLALLQRDRPAQVRQIHEAAVAHYLQHATDATDRTEEIYHRLALDQESYELASRWDAQAGASLAASMAELPPRAQAWLASQLGMDPPADLRERASAAEWERLIGRKVRDLLRYLEPGPALALLAERDHREPASPLFALEAKALVLEERFAEALDVLARGVDSVPEAPNRGRLAELLWLQAQVLERLGRPRDAARVLERAEDVALAIADPLCRLQILVQQLLLRRETPAAFPEDDGVALRDRLAALCARLSEEGLGREQSLTRASLALLGPGYTEVFIRGITHAGIGEADPAARGALAQALEGLSIEDAAARSQITALANDLRSTVYFGQLVDTLVGIPAIRAITLPALAALLDAQPQSLAAANLVGIDEYREPWELELPSEAV